VQHAVFTAYRKHMQSIGPLGRLAIEEHGLSDVLTGLPVASGRISSACGRSRQTRRVAKIRLMPSGMNEAPESQQIDGHAHLGADALAAAAEGWRRSTSTACR
jgi:hypothetical protein